jgi:transposase
MGRNTKLTKQVQAKIVRLLKQGNTFEVAALSAGISRSTFYNWLQLGEIIDGEDRPEELYIDFREAIEMAVAQAEADRVKTIMDAAKGTGRYKDAADWKAAAWFLERRNPEEWGRRDRLKAEIDHSGEVAQKNEYDIKQTIEFDPEAREAAKQLFRRAALAKNLE